MGSPAHALPGVNGRRLRALALATLAIPAIFATSAQASGDLTIQAESMTRSSTTATAIISGTSLEFKRNATASKTVTTGAATSLTLRVKGDQCNGRGAPKAAVSIDGRTVSTITVPERSYTSKPITVSLKAGSHKIAVAYTNDSSSSSCNRNLYLDYVALSSAAPAPSDVPAPTPTPAPGPAPAGSAPAPADGSVLWGSDFENVVPGVGTPANRGPFSTLYKTIQHDYDSTVKCTIEASSDVARTGAKAMKMTVGASAPTGGVGRCLPTANVANAKQGTDLYYGLSIYLKDFDLSQIVGNRSYFFDGQGFRYTNTSANGPGAAMIGARDSSGPVWTSGMNPSGTVGDFSAGSRTVCRLVNNQWIDIVQHVRWSAGSDGLYETWCNGVKVGSTYNGPTLMSSGLTAERRIGVYEGVAVSKERTLYFDNDRIGTSYASVDPSR
jgi:hypothetical protein